jgi:hypothetical protein
MRNAFRVRLLSVAAILALLVVMPAVAGTGPDEPRVGGWIEDLVSRVGEWLADVGLTSSWDADGGASTNSGGCFDPWGKPRPCPEVSTGG